jgi:ArsR family transcriptional regulator
MYDMPTSEKLRTLNALFRALADPTRLRLLHLLATEEMCVGYFVEALRTTQPKVSRHLAYLRRAGIVTTHRERHWIHYRLNPPTDPFAARLLRETLDALAKDPRMQHGHARLLSICAAPQKFVEIQFAPRPTPILEAVANDTKNTKKQSAFAARGILHQRS